jgi:hypothetical protein
MKCFRSPVLVALILSLAISGLAAKDEFKSGQKIERSAVVNPQATITVCVMSGEINIRGWDKNEVHVRSVDVDEIELKRIDKSSDPMSPASRIDVMLYGKAEKQSKRDCETIGDVDLDVPSGATVQVQTRDGDIHIMGVAAAYAGSQNGDIVIEGATKLVEAGSVGGSIFLKDSRGRVNLSSAGGSVEATNIKSATSDDTFEVGTVSGDIQLMNVSNHSVSAKSVNGTVSMSGPLTKGGSYGFVTTSGDINLFMPGDSSFQLNAKISDKQSIVSDFTLKPVENLPLKQNVPSPKVEPQREAAKGGVKGSPPKPNPVVVAPMVVKPSPAVAPYALRRITAVCGNGDSSIAVASFGGTLRLKKL